MRLTSITEVRFSPDGDPSRKLRFDCQYDPEKSPDDVGFTKAPPSGFAEYVIDNPSALEQFVVGDHYYVDFTPVPKTPAT